MFTLVCRCVLLVTLMLPVLLAAQMQREVSNSIEDFLDTPVAHPLTWWTENPLRLDNERGLALGRQEDSGKKLSSDSYLVQQKVSKLGTVQGNRIVQVMQTIRGKPGILLYGADLSADVSQWKSLLVQLPGTTGYFEIYQLHAGMGTYSPFQSAEIYGSGDDAILGTDDQDSGNGGGCTDGCWWFDKGGAHPVDFEPRYTAMMKAIPAHAGFTRGCWTMHPEQARMETWVQEDGATCRSCGGLGTLWATYKVHHGVATAKTITFVPDANNP